MPQKRKAVRHLMSCHSISERRACGLVGIGRSSFRYEHKRDSQDWLRARIKVITLSRKRIHVQLRRDGYEFNKKRIRRLYCMEGLQLRPKRPRRNVSGSRRYSKQKPATASNDFKAFHSRQPLLLDSDQANTWLEERADLKDLRELLKAPLPQNMLVRALDPSINNSRLKEAPRYLNGS